MGGLRVGAYTRMETEYICTLVNCERAENVILQDEIFGRGNRGNMTNQRLEFFF